jgi:hypothetical protein
MQHTEPKAAHHNNDSPGVESAANAIAAVNPISRLGDIFATLVADATIKRAPKPRASSLADAARCKKATALRRLLLSEFMNQTWRWGIDLNQKLIPSPRTRASSCPKRPPAGQSSLIQSKKHE